MARNNGKAQKPGGAPEAKPVHKFPRDFIPIAPGGSEREDWKNHSRLVVSPALAVLKVVQQTETKSFPGGLDVPSLMKLIEEMGAEANRGDLSKAEAMLYGQAVALQSLFARLAERGMTCENLSGFEGNLRVALKAQAQCRAALETLFNIKNPRPVAFVQQANIANGPQQVNNGIARAGTPVEPNQLSGGNNELRTDAGAPALEGGNDPALEAVGKIYRAENA